MCSSQSRSEVLRDLPTLFPPGTRPAAPKLQGIGEQGEKTSKPMALASGSAVVTPAQMQASHTDAGITHVHPECTSPRGGHCVPGGSSGSAFSVEVRCLGVSGHKLPAASSLVLRLVTSGPNRVLWVALKQIPEGQEGEDGRPCAQKTAGSIQRAAQSGVSWRGPLDRRGLFLCLLPP